MSLSREELKRLIVPVLLAAALVGAGIAAIWAGRQSLLGAQAELAAAQSQRQQNSQRLARIAEEEREVNEKIAVYRQMKQLHILGEEQRLEWADAMTRIRTQRELLDLKYRVEKQRRLSSFQGKPGNVDFYASVMKVDIALLHEGDLLRFLADLRDSGNAFYSVRRCAITRIGPATAALTTLQPRLRAECDIDLVTVRDEASKS